MDTSIKAIKHANNPNIQEIDVTFQKVSEQHAYIKFLNSHSGYKHTSPKIYMSWNQYTSSNEISKSQHTVKTQQQNKSNTI